MIITIIERREFDEFQDVISIEVTSDEVIVLDVDTKHCELRVEGVCVDFTRWFIENEKYKAVFIQASVENFERLEAREIEFFSGGLRVFVRTKIIFSARIENKILKGAKF